ncbi:MAG TPA: hypothetical protein VNV87_05550 [Acidimicrobiales bacterium]|jgi:hypothetical protein|nr:hypothetical protein [Acidimicrobiales bacterium]
MGVGIGLVAALLAFVGRAHIIVILAVGIGVCALTVAYVELGDRRKERLAEVPRSSAVPAGLPLPQDGHILSASVGPVLSDGVQVVRYEHVPKESDLTPPAPVQLAITLQRIGSYGEYSADARPPLNRGVRVKVRAYVASPSDSEPVTLLSARAGIQLEHGEVVQLETEVSQYLDKTGPTPPNYRFPPVVDPGTTLEVESTFYARAMPTEDLIGMIVPQQAHITGFVLVDQLKREHHGGDCGPLQVVRGTEF